MAMPPSSTACPRVPRESSRGLLVDCQESVPTAPSPAAGVHIYSDANFQGFSTQLTKILTSEGPSLELLADARNLQLMRGPCLRDDDWSDCTSSIRVRRR